MKKLLTLALALLMVVGLSVPAMAFTSDAEADDDSVPYDLKIYLVEYDDNDFFGIASLPPSDRGYAKNEIVAAVVELYVPEDETIQMPDNFFLILSGENVDLDITDNSDGVSPFPTLQASFENGPEAVAVPTWNPLDINDHDKIYIQTVNLPGEDTYRWLFFAKVTGDDASLCAELEDGFDRLISPEEFPEPFGPITITLDGIMYQILKAPALASDDIRYTINIGPDSDYLGHQIWIEVDEDYVSQGMSIDGVALGVNTKGELGIVDPANLAKILTDGELYDDIMDIYNDVVVDVFGMDYMLIGNYVRDSFFEDLVSPKTLIATVDIAPWTAYVTVPDNIVVDPPKTGDAASIMGFVMVALSGAGVVALRKRG